MSNFLTPIVPHVSCPIMNFSGLRRSSLDNKWNNDMMNASPITGKLWSIVLASGDSGRLGTLIQRWLGHSKPKQYCAFVGARSPFQHALDRAAIFCRPEHIVTVVSRDARPEACPQLGGRGVGVMLAEPKHVGTVAELYLSLTYVR